MGSSPLARGLPRCRGACPGRRGIIPARAGFTPPSCRARSSHWDHPRSRGVYLRRQARHNIPGGSSPLARGLPAPRQPVQLPRGIIPARAGFTQRGPQARMRGEDHPRSRGVYRAGRRPRPAGGGSSPLARGLHAPLRERPAPPGIIPARAGFTCSGDTPHRMRGGSSPLARGLLRPTLPVLDQVRIIPARAGFTAAPTPRSSRRWGSSPLARGLLQNRLL